MKTIFLLSLLLLIYLGSADRLLTGNNNLTYDNSLCKNWDSKHLKCTECYQGCTMWEEICVHIVENCSKWDQQGDCIQCEMGYGDVNNQPINGTCPQQINNQTVGSTIDINCQCHDDNRTCIDCYAGYYLDFDNFCEVLPQNCTGADQYGSCTSCIEGFMVENGTCVQRPCTLDLCLTFNIDQTACTSCPNRSYLVDGCCIQVNGYCSQWVATTGVCTACYVGYKINKNNNKECIRA